MWQKQQQPKHFWRFLPGLNTAQGLHYHVNQLPAVIGLLYPRLHSFVNQFALFAVYKKVKKINLFVLC